MRLSLLFIFCHLALSQFSQVVIGKPWTFACGASTNTGLIQSSSLNLRYISPRFKWSNYELTEEEEKHPQKFQNTRLMAELIYRAPLKVLCTAFNLQSRIINYKRFSLDLYGGMKFFFVTGPEFASIPFLGKGIWYMNIGILCQFNLGIIAPFADIGGDGILTVGTEVNLPTIYKKIKKKIRPPYIQQG